MYKLKDKHIDYILNDISARGVTIEDLQYNLLDHICCIIENNLEENGDFENFYSQTVKRFFKAELKEIEDETISLIIFKHYYTMKKVMIISGALSVFLLTAGIILKFLHLPGAAIGIMLGILILSFVFLPLMFLLKIKEKQSIKDKLTVAFGAFAGVLISLGTLFKIMHWPFANMMMMSSIIILLTLFLPFYFFTGIRNPETKVNTIVSSVLLISACGLLFTLMRSPRSSFLRDLFLTENFIRDQKIFLSEWQQSKNQKLNDSLKNLNEGENIIELCEAIKLKIIEEETGSRSIEQDVAKGLTAIRDHSFNDTYREANLDEPASKLWKEIDNYNKTFSEPEYNPINTKGMFYNSNQLQNINSFIVLDQLTQIQRMVLQNKKTLIAIK